MPTSPRRKQPPQQHRTIGFVARLAVLTMLIVCSVPAQAKGVSGELTLSTVDPAGIPLEHVVVSLHANSLTASLSPKQIPKIMDQRQLQFAPSVLAVQSGTTVRFPNQDDVRHHVYSFSHPNAFELKLYHGESVANQRFDHEGVVVLGCNIHDGMVGYLRVVDTPLFGTSGANGTIQLNDLPPGNYELQVWHPDIGLQVIRQPISVPQGSSSKTLTITTQAQHTPDIKAAHPLQSLFRD